MSWSITNSNVVNPRYTLKEKSELVYDLGSNPGGVDSRRFEVEAQNALSGGKSVKVEVVDLDKTDHEIYPAATNAALNSIAGATKKYIGIFKKYSGGKTIEPNFELKFSGTQFNEEILNSPLYRTVREGGVNLELGIVGTLPIPALSIIIPKVGSVGAYLELGANVGLTTKVIYRKTVNTSSYKRVVNQFEFEANAANFPRSPFF